MKTEDISVFTPRPRFRWLRILLLVLAVFICGALMLLAYLPVPEDPVIPLAEQGGGARQGDDSNTGLQLVWSEIPPANPEHAELGRLLFYDPYYP